jgi:hypothetical protein
MACRSCGFEFAIRGVELAVAILFAAIGFEAGKQGFAFADWKAAAK